MATSSDIRICSADTKFSVKEVDIGIAADVGTLSRLPKVVGNHSWVKDVAFTARVFGAEEALKFGFVSNVFPDKAKAVEGGLELAKLIASKSPVAVQGTKDILNHARENTTIDNLKYTAVWNSSALHTEDTKKALLSGIQKRKPTFEKL
jgi:delta(3,5)-delta(2,4)-dienoyl-CoA isomerase